MNTSFQDELDVRHALLQDAGIGGLSEECLAEILSMVCFDELYNAILVALNDRSEYLFYLGAMQGAQKIKVTREFGFLDHEHRMGHA